MISIGQEHLRLRTTKGLFIVKSARDGLSFKTK